MTTIAVGFAILSTTLSGQESAPKKSSVPLPSAKAMGIVTAKILPIISPNVDLFGKAEVTNPQWTFVRNFDSEDGKKWQIWKVTGDFSYSTGQRLREFHEVAVNGDEVTFPSNLEWGGLFDNLAKKRMKPPSKPIDDKAFKAAESVVVRRLANADYRRSNLDRTIRALIEEEAEKQAEKKGK